jgi:beta-mannanase
VDFYEVGVFGIMFLLMRSMRPKRKKKRAIGNQIKDGQVKKITEEKVDKKKAKKNHKSKKEDLLELKELPANKLLPERVGGESSSKNKLKATNDTKEEGKAQEERQSSAQETNENTEEKPTEYQEVTLSDLPSMDTLIEGEEEAPEKQELDLMSVFQTEDAEDSSTSDLAANLFDVDVQNIEKLGSEVSEYLNGMRSR